MLKVFDNIKTIPGIINAMYKYEPDVVFIDFLQYLHYEKNDRFDLVIYNGLRDLKDTAKELDCAIVPLSQLNRSIEHRQDKRPLLSDLKESGGIEELSANVAFMYWNYKYSYDEADKENFELIVAKSRYSPSGRFTVKVEPEYGLFHNS